ncbi:hypothetical protein CI610_02155 [invertebrate metagenome]|uniref:Uncharacterized protein n=1 Tax=invertebrate metagenome TaxID=1711999 RepID=A0A2H9T6R1_9ZZZZ
MFIQEKAVQKNRHLPKSINKNTLKNTVPDLKKIPLQLQLSKNTSLYLRVIKAYYFYHHKNQ